MLNIYFGIDIHVRTSYNKFVKDVRTSLKEREKGGKI